MTSDTTSSFLCFIVVNQREGEWITWATAYYLYVSYLLVYSIDISQKGRGWITWDATTYLYSSLM